MAIFVPLFSFYLELKTIKSVHFILINSCLVISHLFRSPSFWCYQVQDSVFLRNFLTGENTVVRMGLWSSRLQLNLNDPSKLIFFFFCY